MSATYEAIATTTVTTSIHPVTISNIPNTYTDLIAVVSPIANNGNYDLGVRFNSDTGNNYSYNRMQFNADNSGNVYADRGASVSYIPTGTNVATVTPYPVFIHIQNYASTNINKSCIIRNARETYANTLNASQWRDTSAINEISFILAGGGSTTFKAGTVITIYGIRAE